LLASYRAFFAQNLCRSSSFFSVTATTFRYTQESSDSHPASFLSLEMAMRLVGSVSDALGNLLRCNASLSLFLPSLPSLPSLSLFSLSRSPAWSVSGPPPDSSAHPPRVLASVRLPPVRPAFRPVSPRDRPSSARPSSRTHSQIYILGTYYKLLTSTKQLRKSH
jgi:hypothetical protein